MKQHTGICCISLDHVLFSSIVRSLIFIGVILLPQWIISNESSMLFEMNAPSGLFVLQRKLNLLCS